MNKKLLDDAREAGLFVHGSNIYAGTYEKNKNITNELVKFAELQQPQWIDAKLTQPYYVEGKDYSLNVFGLYKGYKEKLTLSIFQLIFSDDDEGNAGYAWARIQNYWHDLREAECEWDDDYEVMYWMPIELLCPPINTED